MKRNNVHIFVGESRNNVTNKGKKRQPQKEIYKLKIGDR